MCDDWWQLGTLVGDVHAQKDIGKAFLKFVKK